MAKSRMVNTEVIRNPDLNEPQHYVTWELPDHMKGYNPTDLLKNQQTYSHTWQFGDRMDKLASRYLGDDQYGWIICLVNNIGNPFSMQPGDVLKIPINAEAVLEQLDM
jgi:hypothetical protein